MTGLYEFALECKNRILKLTDLYTSELDLIKMQISENLPQRDLYEDNVEIELIKLMKFIEVIKKYSLEAISEGMIYFDMRNKIKNYLIDIFKDDSILAKVITLISEGYSKSEIANKLGYSQDTMRLYYKRIGDKLLAESEFIKKYNEHYSNCEHLNENGSFKDVYGFIKDLF